MTYFTDMLLIPGDSDNADPALRRALNGSRMMRLAQAAADPDLVLDLKRIEDELETYNHETRKFESFEYHNYFENSLKSLMDDKDHSVEYETGGAWGGPGGSSEYWGSVKYEPEVTYPVGVSDDSPVTIQVENMEGVTIQGYNSALEVAEDIVKDMGPTNEEAAWEIAKLPEYNRLDVRWVPNERVEPEYDPPEPDYDWDDGPY